MLHAGGAPVTVVDRDTVDREFCGRSVLVRTRRKATETAVLLEERHVAHNYSPLPVVAASAEGAWITDVEGRRYLDCLAAYSAVNFGHSHPEIIATAHAQLDKVTLVSRAFHSDRLGTFCEALARLCAKDMVLPMNSGAEAVESAIKVARKWGTDVKGVPSGDANIVVAQNNFHGRTISIVSFSSDPSARGGFGPFTPGFRSVPFGDAAAVARAIDENTVAVLLEPIQGEAGIIVPPDDYLPTVRALCSEHNVLMIADEIQSGLARTGTTFACEHWSVVPDMYLLGKALGGGVVPLSAVVANADVLGVLHPGEHGSTFGGNPLAAAIGTTVVSLLRRGEFQRKSTELGLRLHSSLRSLVGHGVLAVRGLGLWAGVDVDPAVGTAKRVSLRLAGRGVLVKDTQESTLRFAPPLVVTAEEIDWAVDQLAGALTDA
jgi:ornithine--oxo-acid transaminase